MGHPNPLKMFERLTEPVIGLITPGLGSCFYV